MTVAKILHDKAMEFVDEAKMASMEGNEEAARTFYEKAFTLEKEAVEHLPAENQDDIIPYMYRRSAASLAYHIGKFEEARNLADTTLAGNPPDFIRQQLLELKSQLSEVSNNGRTDNSEYAADAAKSEILVVLERIEKTNELIARHRKSKNPDATAMEKFQRIKHDVIQQLAGLLKRYEVDVRV